MFRPIPRLIAVLACALLPVADLVCVAAEDEPLTDLQVERALEAIWLKTPAPEQRSPDSAKRAALEAYLHRLGPGTALLSAAETAPLKEADFAPLRFHSEMLPGSTGYIRLGAFTEELPVRLDPVLRDFAQMGARSVILDVRATPAQGSLALAAEVAGSFLPADTQVFSVRTSERPAETLRTKKAAPARFRLIVLTGQRTAGPVEALAASLRAQSGATILGVSTQGQAADFEVIPLGKEAFLRLPVREAIVPGAPGLVPDGLHPDIICSATPEATDAALWRASQEGRVSPLLKQTERPRLNEAALVAGENPETEAWIQAQLRRGKPQPEPMPRDAALTMAMDFLMAWESLYGKTQVLP